MAISVVTDVAREKMLKARAGVAPLPKIIGMAFGDGAENESKEIIPPVRTQSELCHELLRKVVDGYETVTNLLYRYQCTLEEAELGGKNINEIALYDEEDDLIAIETFRNKGKDDNRKMIFEMEDVFL